MALRRMAAQELLILAGLLFLSFGAVLAQQVPPIVPPSILSFQSDLTGISVEAAEAGETSLTLSWRTSGLGPDHRLLLQSYGQRGWTPLVGTENVALAADGIYVARVRNTCGFCPPTYRLAIIDSHQHLLDQWIITIPFEAEAGQPRITSFTTGVERIDANALAQRTGRITVFWEVENRVPGSHLLFEQVLEGGGVVSVELPRPDAWVASAGQGEVAPVLPQSENYVLLRLRLVDIVAGTVYDEATLTVPLIGAVTAPVLPTPVPQPPTVVVAGELPTADKIPEDAPPQILSFIVTPHEVDRGGAVTVSWSVANATSVLLARLSPSGQFAEFYTNPGLAGVWTLNLPEYHVDRAEFYLLAIGADDAAVEQRATVLVRCPYTYFFGVDPQAACPETGEIQVEAGYQPFERGFMLWRGDTREIYVYLNDGHFSIFPDTFVDGEPLRIVTETPPGLYEPARGFARVWLNNASVMSGLGWATAPELPYIMRVQRSGDLTRPRTYFALPDGRVVFMVNDTWGILGQ